MIRNHFTYTESVILKKARELESIQLPTPSSDMVTTRKFEKIHELLESQLTSATEQEKLELAILETQQKSLSSVKGPVLIMLPLSQHLFFNNTL